MSQVRPRYARILAAATAMLVTSVAVLGSTGILPVDRSPESASAVSGQPVGLSGSVSASLPRLPSPTAPGDSPAADPPAPGDSPAALPHAAIALPDRSGKGMRVVFDIGDQRVWLVSSDDRVLRTYLVSGSLTDNLGPGSYEVYSKSRHAIGIDNSGTMQYMVRFTQGENAAIGFHDIPVHEGELVQTRSQLGTPQSHGCIRQLRVDARALWAFAPVGTPVEVLA